jgi:ubiquinone/menaquinone biosynthesis C-methylase UbiE
VGASFDAIATAYAREFRDELDRKPFDRDVLDGLVESKPGATALDLGCGAAGHIGRYLDDRGWSVTGVDISVESIEVARRLNPGMSFVVADNRSLPFDSESIDAVVAFYCLIYGTDGDIVAAMSEIRRVLRPDGMTLVAVHGALDDVVHEESFTDFLGTSIEITMRYTSPATFAGLAERAGLRIDRVAARPPYEFEHASRRIYVLAGRH